MRPGGGWCGRRERRGQTPTCTAASIFSTTAGSREVASCAATCAPGTRSKAWGIAEYVPLAAPRFISAESKQEDAGRQAVWHGTYLVYRARGEELPGAVPLVVCLPLLNELATGASHACRAQGLARAARQGMAQDAACQHAACTAEAMAPPGSEVRAAAHRATPHRTAPTAGRRHTDPPAHRHSCRTASRGRLCTLAQGWGRHFRVLHNPLRRAKMRCVPPAAPSVLYDSAQPPLAAAGGLLVIPVLQPGEVP